MIPSSPSVRLVRLGTLLAVLLPLAAFTAACSGGGGGSSPTDPGAPAVGGSASISGQVSVTGNASGGLAAAPAAPGLAPTRSAGAARAAGPGALPAPDSTGSGVTVRVQGTGLSTVADGNGAFSLAGVPQGNQVLVFETAQGSAGLPVEDIRPNERIRVSVRVNGGNAQVTDIDRDGGSQDEGPGDEQEELGLSLQLSPDTWNLNYEHSSGTVAAFIRGEGFEDVVLDSIVLLGDDDSADPLEPVSATRQGNNVRARFAKSEVLEILDGPENGSTHTVTLAFEVAGLDGVQELTAQVRIAGPDDGEEDDEELDDLSLQLSPSTWNLNYAGASGSVTALIRGRGLDAIDTDSVELVGDDPEADPLPASTARREGNHVRARFPKNQVLDLLDEPEKGSRHTVIVRFTSDDGAESHELEAEVRVTGKDR